MGLNDRIQIDQGYLRRAPDSANDDGGTFVEQGHISRSKPEDNRPITADEVCCDPTSVQVDVPQSAVYRIGAVRSDTVRIDSQGHDVAAGSTQADGRRGRRGSDRHNAEIERQHVNLRTGD